MKQNYKNLVKYSAALGLDIAGLCYVADGIGKSLGSIVYNADNESKLILDACAAFACLGAGLILTKPKKDSNLEQKAQVSS